MKTFSELLAAAKDVYSQIGNLAPAHIRHVVTPKQRDNLQDAIAAAEREAAELAEPISTAFLSGMGWVFSRADNQWKHPTERLWFSMETSKLCVDCYASITMESKGQLLSLLKGLGIEVVA